MVDLIDEADVTPIDFRPYQTAAIATAVDAHRSRHNPVLSLPTGSGKSVVAAGIVARLTVIGHERIVVTVPSRELAEQNEKALLRMISPDEVGVVCAALGRRELDRRVLVGTPQSLAGAITFDPTCVLVDECFPAGTPVATPQGDQPIEDLREGDEVLHALGIGRVKRLFRSTASEPLIRLRLSDGTAVDCTPGHPFLTPRGWVCAGQLERGARVYREEDMRELRRHLSAEALPIGPLDAGKVLGEEEVLLRLLLEEAGEPDARPRGPRSDEREPQEDRSSSTRQGGQRDGADEAAGSASQNTRGGVAARACGSHQETAWVGLSNELQNRCGEPRTDDRVRTGGQFALGPQVERGSKEGRSTEIVRVESVSSLERASSRTVFNLHVSGHPSYFAHGVLVHNCHQMPLHRGSWFARLFDGLPRGRATPRIGLSATTFRTADGAIFGPGAWFSCQPFEITVQDLVDLGHLAPVRYVAPGSVMTTEGVGKSAGDYNTSQLARANLDRVPGQVAAIFEHLRERQRGMIFAVNVDHADAFARELSRRGERPALIIGAMDADERRAGVADFKAGRRRIAVTVSAGLTGFDVPEIDLIASCRPTMSSIIHVQSVGRGTRPADGKADCLVLDFAGNLKTFGPVHAPHFDKSGQPLGGIAPWRPCRSCGTFNHFHQVTCTHCVTELPPRQVVTANDLEYGMINFWKESVAIKDLVARRGRSDLPVESIALHAYRKASDPNSITCMVSVGLGGMAIARHWFKRFNDRRWQAFWTSLLGDNPPPASLHEAYARRGELVRPAAVDLEADGNFWRVKAADYGGDAEALGPAPAAPKAKAVRPRRKPAKGKTVKRKASPRSPAEIIESATL